MSDAKDRAHASVGSRDNDASGIYETLAATVDAFGAAAVMQALAEACEAASDHAEQIGCNFRQLRGASLFLRAATELRRAERVGDAEHLTGVTLVRALHVLSKRPTDETDWPEEERSARVMHAEPYDVGCPVCLAPIGEGCQGPTSHPRRVSLAQLEAARREKIALFSVDEEHEDTEYATLCVLERGTHPEWVPAIKPLGVGDFAEFTNAIGRKVSIRRVA